MVAILLLGHAGLGLLALGTVFLGEKWRSRVLTVLCLIGLGLGVALAVAAGSDEIWRTNRLDAGAIVPALGVSAAWLVTAAAPAPRGRWMTVALVGVASSSLALAGSNRWTAPALVFIGGLALAVAVLGEGRLRPQVATAVFVATIAAAVALMSRTLQDEVWTLGGGLEGWPRYVLVGAAVVQAGALPGVGVWGLLKRGGAAALPLLVAGAFVFMDLALEEPDRWAALALMALALAATAWSLLRTKPSVTFSVSSVILFLFAIVAASPSALPIAALAAIVVSSGASLWPVARGEASAERSLLLAPVTALPVFVAMTIAAVTAIEQSVVAEGEIEKVPWTLVVVLLGVVGAGLAGVASRTGGARPGGSKTRSTRSWPAALRSGELDAWSLFALRLLVLASIAAVFAPGDFLGETESFVSGEPRQLTLLSAAVAVGAVVAWLSSRTPVAQQPDRLPLAYEIPEPGPLVARVLSWVSVVLGAAAIATIAWVVIEGLRVGFL
ncbi:MAG: hypothetical protein M3280_00555 [Actinomycetota bacterium]|nr:hypothetical protein [Actinomycetota bacterium]